MKERVPEPAEVKVLAMGKREHPKLKSLDRVFLDAMALVILLSRSENGPQPWIREAKAIVKRFEEEK